MYKLTFMILAFLLSSQKAYAVRFGLISGSSTVEELSYFTESGSGGGHVECFTEGSYNVTKPYDGMYLWAGFDARLDSLSSILPENGSIILCCTGTSRWNSKWYTNVESIPQGEVNNRPIDVDAYADEFEALITRYGSSGVHIPSSSSPVHEWSLWCEPDGGQCMVGATEFIDDSNSTELGMFAYYNIARRACSRIRSCDPTGTIISGSFLSPASTDPDSSYWAPGSRQALQLCFSGDESASGSVPFRWPAGPDAFDYHPYDSNSMEDDDDESYYDPLVIDDDDFMFRVRNFQLLDDSLDHWFSGSNLEPVWDEMPLYLLEFCPIYSLESWRLRSDALFDPDSISYHTKWRANYHITGILELMRSPNLSVITPWPACSDQWWIRANPGETYPCVPATNYVAADSAYLHLSNVLYQHSFLSDSTISSGTFDSIMIWTFEPSDTLELEPYVYALRTFRDSKNSLFDEQTCRQLELPVRACVESVELSSLTGQNLGIVYPDSNNTIHLNVDGYILYAVETLTVDQSTASTIDHSFSSSHRVSADRPGLMYIYDIVGRCVASRDLIDTSHIAALRVWSDFVRSESIPAGCYLLRLIDSDGSFLESMKVVIPR